MNLRRICNWLVAGGLVAPSAALAAGDCCTPGPRHHVQGYVRRVRPGTVPGHADDLQDGMPARGLHGPQVRVGAAATGLHQDRLQNGL